MIFSVTLSFLGGLSFIQFLRLEEFVDSQTAGLDERERALWLLNHWKTPVRMMALGAAALVLFALAAATAISDVSVQP